MLARLIHRRSIWRSDGVGMTEPDQYNCVRYGSVVWLSQRHLTIWNQSDSHQADSSHGYIQNDEPTACSRLGSWDVSVVARGGVPSDG